MAINLKKYFLNIYKQKLINGYREKGFDVNSFQSSGQDLFNISIYGRIVTQGNQFGGKALIFNEWGDGTKTVYSNEYNPQQKRHVNGEEYGNVPFTTIYDFGIDSNTGNRYYYKATDKNGNGLSKLL